MDPPHNKMTTETPQTVEYHKLYDKWVLWAHLPHNTDWSINSYIKVFEFTTIEDTVALIEELPSVLVENCMLFIMRDGIKPIWEDPQNRNGGSFSYKVLNKLVYEVWKDLTYCIVGNSISQSKDFVDSVSGITISPKKNFCIVKVWMSNCAHHNPDVITNDIKDIGANGCLFKKHVPEY